MIGRPNIYPFAETAIGANRGVRDLARVLEYRADQRVYRSPLSVHNTRLLMLTQVAYFVYLGRCVGDVTPKFVELHVSTIAAGAQTAEVGLFRSPTAPKKAGQTLTKLVATGTVDTLVTTGVKRNTTGFTTLVPAGTHLWAGFRTQMATTQPTCVALGYDMLQGYILTLAASGALTAATTFAGAIVAVTDVQVCPDLRLTLD